MEFLRRIWSWLFPAKADKPKRTWKRREEGSAHYYLGDLLDSMDSLFSDFDLLRKSEPDIYSLTKKWGATVVSSSVQVGAHIEPHVLKSMPAFGCFHSAAEDDGVSDMVPARFVYFMKERRPVNVHHQTKVIGPAGHDTYRCGAIFSVKGKACVNDFFVAVSPDGEIKPLKVCTPVNRGFETSGTVSGGGGPKIKNQHAAGGHKTRSLHEKSARIVRMEWGYPPQLVAYAADNKKTVEEMVIGWFSVTANLAATREAGMTVTASKGGCAAAFAIDMIRTPYFFADRKKTVTENGKTKPIIHHVRGHYRTLAGGSKKFIKPHFRGVREFQWNGYDVRVGMAGWHGMGVSEFTVPAVDARETNAKSVDVDYVAEVINNRLA